MLVLLSLLGISALVVLSSIWRGFVLSILWGWFMVPLFGLPALNIPFAIGIALVVGFLTHQSSNENEKTDWGNSITMAVMYPALILLVGWVVTFFR
jgi:hypothetical protein